MIKYDQYMTVFAWPIERLHEAVRTAYESDAPENYDQAVRLLIYTVLCAQERKGSNLVYVVDQEMYLP